MGWQPAATLDRLRQRAALLAHVRDFFCGRGVLEVETSLLCSSGITDPSIEPLRVQCGQSITGTRFLQTSPEYAMKRLLAAGSGPIYQVAKAFRDGEAGPRHNPEFTLLEWYRPGFDHHQLMREVADLVLSYLGTQPVEYHAYRALFQQELGVDPLTAELDTLQSVARAELDVGGLSGDRDLWLDLLMSHLIEPRLIGRGLCFVYDYPESQAALARVSEVDGMSVGHRFELYVNGLELANGYWELGDAVEQRRRFVADNQRRCVAGQNEQPLDEHLLAALAAGMPDCAGVALGLDRLLMLGAGCEDIRQTLAFDWSRS
ncbi:EF-P lysine aminoacylase EpmA [Pseudohalioglobus lutimaris]|uniref:EF-P lysine aminoacylase GenX n=1 Tax=Pseudohalioglobus lutimaris TaxID=1737061 RepID=A0A2N5X470_9GAMM|nr:EF-P lysine aminoacylase EpmA [Pseudohalioglobus lutimaris]PLW69277.1 EF-P lysine aminoacylase GenX [Pseudohalioglobus lutimaris]